MGEERGLPFILFMMSIVSVLLFMMWFQLFGPHNRNIVRPAEENIQAVLDPEPVTLTRSSSVKQLKSNFSLVLKTLNENELN